MRYYDTTKAKRLIKKNAPKLVEASLGMHEDWYYTAVQIWQDGEYTRKIVSTNKLQELFEKLTKAREEGLKIFDKGYENYTKHFFAGIAGSSWATPALNLVYNDGTEEMIPCFVGEQDNSQPKWFSLGPLSGPVQARIEPLK